MNDRLLQFFIETDSSTRGLCTPLRPIIRRSSGYPRQPPGPAGHCPISVRLAHASVVTNDHGATRCENTLQTVRAVPDRSFQLTRLYVKEPMYVKEPTRPCAHRVDALPCCGFINRTSRDDSVKMTLGVLTD